jgi:hypothetical protein
MQPTSLEKPIEFWWPHPDALQDLTVEDGEGGFDLSAPDDTECGAWLSYWNQSPEHVQIFNEAFTESLRNHLDTLKDENGENENLPVGSQSDSEQAQDECSGPQP